MIRGSLSESHQKLFWAKVTMIPFHDCWEWTAAKNEKGYGVFGRGKETDKASRISWRLIKGEIKNGLFVLHKCGNPGCVNPNHLFLGTNLDNVKDMIKKARNSKPPPMGGWNKKHFPAEIIKFLGKIPDTHVAILFNTNKHVIQRLRKNHNISALKSETQFKTGMPHPRWSRVKRGI